MPCWSGVTCSFLRLITHFNFVTLNPSSPFIPVSACRFAVRSQSRLSVPVGVSWRRDYSVKRQMPKKDKPVRGQVSSGQERQAEAAGPVARDKSGAVTITVHVKPGSKHNGITDVSAEAVGVAVAAPPTDGEANAELVRYLADVLDLKKSHVVLDKGSRSRDKVIRLDSSLSPEEVLKKLRQAAG
ncbi:UPF0235 protein C15orf40 homolog [Myripristis murdjan]|uniref:Zgc:193812 n=1 Tax=Myripristis murdjan TaxID=586833 RepID=A0A667Y757_9TELE|nr:UPF0235 protein C15orf40 homolog [Myripristis murdjan]